MNIVRIVLIAVGIFVLNAAVSAEEQQRDHKVYDCDGEEMKLMELEDGRLALEGKQLTGYVSIHRATGMYRGSVDGWGSQHKTPKEALEAACRWLLRKAEADSVEALEKQLHEFYEELK